MTRSKLMMIILFMAAGLLAIGAAAQVSREEFDALRDQIKTLENKVSEVEQRARQNSGEIVLLKGTIERMEKSMTTSKQTQPLNKNDQKLQGDKAEAKALQGRDLVAWKLAREYVRKEVMVPMIYSKLTGEATTDYMRKTKEGDYEFLFWRWPSYIKGRAADRIIVTVVDMGSELRIKTSRRISTPYRTIGGFNSTGAGQW